MAALLAVAPADAAAQIDFSAQLDLVHTAQRDSLGLNRAFRGDNPFNPVRLRVYARSWVTDRIGVFTELLYDIEASARLNGAYAVINEIGGQPWLNARLGLAPNLLGSFGLRSTYFNSNPLVGVPLIWHHRTNLRSNGLSTPASLTGTTGEPGGGAPLLYDSCWNIQWELLGEVGAFEYSVGFTPGSQSNPVRSRTVEGNQWLARVGVVPTPGLRIGLSGAHGPWLSAPTPDAGGNLPYPEDPSDFDQSVYGLDIEYAHGRVVFHSEVFGARWETPMVTEALESLGGYAELRVGLSPGWYLAGRWDAMAFGDVETDSQSGARSPWDQNTYRTEVALGYRVSRQVLLKVDWQRSATSSIDFSQNLFAVQLSSVF